MRWPPVNGLSTPSAQGAYSLQLSTAKPAASPRKATTLHLAANKDTGISAILFSTSSPTCCTKAARYYYWTLFLQSSKRSLGLRSSMSFFPPVLGSPFHQRQLCMPTLGYHCLCPCGQGGKAAFQRARAFSPRHEYAPFFVVLYSFP